MSAVSETVTHHRLFRYTAMVAVLAPVALLAACSQPQPAPPPAPTTVETAPPAPPPPAPAPIPPARG